MRRDVALIRSKIERSLRLRKSQKAFREGRWISVLERHNCIREGVVLVYHRVNRLTKSGFRPTQYISIETNCFKAHLRLLKQYFSVIPLKKVVDCLQNSIELPQHFVVITFDDGYEDNYTDAYPLLQKYGLPASIFLTAGLVDSEDLLWHDQLEVLLSYTPCRYLSIKSEDGIRNLPLRTIGEKWYAYEYLTRRCLRISPSNRREFLEQLEESLKVSISEEMKKHYKLLNWDQVRTISSSGLVDFGSHTMNHHLVTSLDEKNRDYELGKSQKLIMRETGNKTTLFSYPNGNFDEKAMMHLRAHGYLGACTAERKLLNYYCDSLAIPRVGVSGESAESLAIKLSSIIETSKYMT